MGLPHPGAQDHILGHWCLDISMLSWMWQDILRKEYLGIWSLVHLLETRWQVWYHDNHLFFFQSIFCSLPDKYIPSLETHHFLGSVAHPVEALGYFGHNDFWKFGNSRGHLSRKFILPVWVWASYFECITGFWELFLPLESWWKTSSTGVQCVESRGYGAYLS